MTYRLLSALPLLLAATPVLAEEMTCTGPFAADSSEQRLIDTFGKENVVTGDVGGPEGMTLEATTVFPDDPNRSIEVGWWDEENHRNLSYFRLPPGASAGGVSVGMTIKQVQDLNGKPFKMSGFDWDYGGIADFSGGSLLKLPDGCYLSVTFTHDKEAPSDADYQKVAGDIQVDSDDPLLVEMNTVVADVSLGFPDPNYSEDGGQTEDGGAGDDADPSHGVTGIPSN